MKILILISLLGFANETTTTTQAPQVTAPKVTIKDAKAHCKEQGKAGKDLLACIKEQKNSSSESE